jgi:hypothetical protein
MENGPVVGQMTDAHVATAGDHPFLMLWTISIIYSPVNKLFCFTKLQMHFLFQTNS